MSFIFCTKSFAQVFQNESYQYYFLTNHQFLNPAFVSLQEEKGEVSASYESFFGPQKIFKTIQLYGIAKLPDEKIYLGGRVYSKIADQFSALSVADINFVYTLVKQHNWKLTSGMWLGAANFLLESNAFYGGNSEWNIDWRFGIFSEHTKLKYGVSFHHFIPTVFVPFEQELKFAREANLYASYKIPFLLYSEIEPTLMYSLREKLDDNIYWGTNYTYDKTYKLICGFKDTQLIQVGASMKIKKINYGFSYHRYFNENQQNGYQLQFSYFFKKDVH